MDHVKRRRRGWTRYAIVVGVTLLGACANSAPTPAPPAVELASSEHGLFHFGFGRSLLCAWFGDLLPFCRTDPNDRRQGQTDFVSADPTAGGLSKQSANDDRFTPSTGTDPFEQELGGAPTVEEGDIYRMFEGRLLNLNYYRGLQVISLDDLSSPAVEGRLEITGTPVELYTMADQAIVLLNGWQGYYGSREDVRVQEVSGGLVLLVDLADTTAPTIVDRVLVPGHIRTSRLVRTPSEAALYVAADEYGRFQDETGEEVWGSRTVVRSLAWSRTGLATRDTVHLGGSVTDIQATPTALLVARSERRDRQQYSTVAAIDIASTDGRMVLGSEVATQGRVQSKFNMDLHDGVLRVVSGRSWGTEGDTNFVETFDARDLGQLSPIDTCTFGDGQDLFATLFLGDRAFFVTYRRVDPFHAFALAADGTCEERAEFVVSGWNNFFRGVHDNTRLVGIGVNDEDRRQTASVSLYDITDLDNPEPLIERASVAAESSWSSASWDDKAFSVLEDVVSVEARGGVKETGLVLLPFNAHNEDGWFNGVQIYSFSDTTLTRRGTMDHGSSVRRSFMAAGATANLSEDSLSLFETSNPDEVSELGRLELAPNYTHVFAFDDHAVRIKDGSPRTLWRPIFGTPAIAPRVEVVALGEHPGSPRTAATFTVPAGSRIFQVGTRLVTMHEEATKEAGAVTEFNVFDLSDPSTPRQASTLRTNRQLSGQPSVCPFCIRPAFLPAAPPKAYATDNALVLVEANVERELVSSTRVCDYWPENECAITPFPPPDEETLEPRCEAVYNGWVTCRTPQGGAEQCGGAIERCRVDTQGQPEKDCTPVDFRQLVEPNCWDDEQHRTWVRNTFHVLDLSDSAAPVLGEPLVTDRDAESVGVLVQGQSLYHSFKRPHAVSADERAYARYFVRQVDLSVPAAPRLGPAVSVPGQLLAVEGPELFTRDAVWNGKTATTAVNRLVYDGNTARLAAHRAFPEQTVDTVLIDDGALFVAGTPKLQAPGSSPVKPASESLTVAPEPLQEPLARLSILDGENLEVLEQLDVDRWASLRDVQWGLALFEVLGGLLIVNAEDPHDVFAQAYFPVRGWPEHILLDDDAVTFAAGRFGIYSFDAATFNLEAPE